MFVTCSLRINKSPKAYSCTSLGKNICTKMNLPAKLRRRLLSVFVTLSSNSVLWQQFPSGHRLYVAYKSGREPLKHPQLVTVLNSLSVILAWVVGHLSTTGHVSPQANVWPHNLEWKHRSPRYCLQKNDWLHHNIFGQRQCTIQQIISQNIPLSLVVALRMQ